MGIQIPVFTDIYNIRVAFCIRDFRPEDFESLWRIDQECFPPEISYSRLELKAYMRRRRAFTLVAEAQGEQDGAQEARTPSASSATGGIAGFIVAHGGTTGHIITIDVVAEERRHGVGTLLLQSAEERLTREGSRAVGLETAVDNLSALTFYKRHGYDVIGTWPRYYSNGVDALVLKKDLPLVQRTGT